MRTIRDQSFEGHEALKGLTKRKLETVSFGGREKSDYALKRGKKLILTHCSFNTPFSLWEAKEVKLDHVTFSSNARSAIWHAKKVKVRDSKFLSVKAIRESNGVYVKDGYFEGEELAWKCSQIELVHCIVQSHFLLFCSRKIKMSRCNCNGSDALQYIENGDIRGCVILSDDALLHCKNVTIYDSDLVGDQIGWYSQDLRLVRCRISGKAAFSFSHHLTLEDCVMEGCEEAFQYCEIDKATIRGNLKSVKNIDSGYLEADHIEEVIETRDKKLVLGKVTIKDRSRQ